MPLVSPLTPLPQILDRGLNEINVTVEPWQMYNSLLTAVSVFLLWLHFFTFARAVI